MKLSRENLLLTASGIVATMVLWFAVAEDSLNKPKTNKTVTRYGLSYEPRSFSDRLANVGDRIEAYINSNKKVMRVPCHRFRQLLQNGKTRMEKRVKLYMNGYKD
ncbi:MAG: hypothetical protein LBU65_13290 [Planctomycetaceae bacterium]|jgi:hypothetical protein|nr:hypothetical protein [Planctomycetaceae bacterium]